MLTAAGHSVLDQAATVAERNACKEIKAADFSTAFIHFGFRIYQREPPPNPIPTPPGPTPTPTLGPLL
jgi:hypothetical protein